jgi:hypothetical protein
LISGLSGGVDWGIAQVQKPVLGQQPGPSDLKIDWDLARAFVMEAALTNLSLDFLNDGGGNNCNVRVLIAILVSFIIALMKDFI